MSAESELPGMAKDRAQGAAGAPAGRGPDVNGVEGEPTGGGTATSASAEVVATTLGEFTRAWLRRIRAGESGALPVVVGLAVIAVIFQSQQSAFLSAGNIVNLLVQGAVFMLLGMAEVFVLLLGEIDLSVGFVGGIGAVVCAILITHPNSYPWWVGILAALAVTSLIGFVQGSLITRLRLPSFVVTLAGLLGWQGVLINILNNSKEAIGGTIRVDNPVVIDIVNGNIDPIAGWIILVVVVALYAGVTLRRTVSRRRAALAAPPLSLSVVKIAIVAAAGVVLLLICNADRGVLAPLRGVPWVIPFVVAVVVGWTTLLNRTRFGRYIYAIGGNPEAARRAGVRLARIRTLAFVLTGLTAGFAGIVYMSRLGSISNNIDGGNLVLLAVASAVIGGTSLFGGQGRPLSALLGGLVIAAINNGLGLLGVGAGTTYIVSALVLLAAVTIDALSRRRRNPAR